MQGGYSQRLRSRWRLAALALVPVFLIAVGKILVSELSAEDIELNPLYTGLVAGNIFLLGFLLAGTLSDYKEAEKLPVELAATLDSIADEFRFVLTKNGHEAARDGLAHVRAITNSVLEWLGEEGPTAKPLEMISALSDRFVALEPGTEIAYINRIKGEQNNARRMVIRIGAIRDTSFVLAGFIVAAMTSAFLIAVLLFIDVGALATDLVLMCTLTFLLSYLLLLIRDLDNPFDYAGSFGGGAVEASLEPLFELQARLATEAPDA